MIFELKHGDFGVGELIFGFGDCSGRVQQVNELFAGLFNPENEGVDIDLIWHWEMLRDGVTDPTSIEIKLPLDPPFIWMNEKRIGRVTLHVNSPTLSIAPSNAGLLQIVTKKAPRFCAVYLPACENMPTSSTTRSPIEEPTNESGSNA
jgi:hypothetical protein